MRQILGWIDKSGKNKFCKVSATNFVGKVQRNITEFVNRTDWLQNLLFSNYFNILFHIFYLNVISRFCSRSFSLVICCQIMSAVSSGSMSLTRIYFMPILHNILLESIISKLLTYCRHFAWWARYFNCSFLIVYLIYYVNFLLYIYLTLFT